eukprot:TRINITY_DN105548_c0_g1_i1.p1 TRINITY_DN105548_c0_g1~~TRINITY_DN105548_c0_g1_i1.p1  ORF type:complete len:143 (-),score=6.68 TRINITY_DN105548_c0_g1_i1:95-523(-)
MEPLEGLEQQKINDQKQRLAQILGVKDISTLKRASDYPLPKTKSEFEAFLKFIDEEMERHIAAGGCKFKGTIWNGYLLESDPEVCTGRCCIDGRSYCDNTCAAGELLNFLKSHMESQFKGHYSQPLFFVSPIAVRMRFCRSR